MLKTWKIVSTAAVLTLLILFGMLLADKHSLRNDLIRLHVVADSDSAEDQAIKLSVRDAVIHAVEDDLKNFSSVSEAKGYLQSNLAVLEAVANETLRAAGSTDTAVVTLCAEAFPIREYNTFKLPSGVYKSLRVTIGSGEGKNWWCVVFPSFCVGAVSEDFQNTAVSAGFSNSLVNTLKEEEGYEISFFSWTALGSWKTSFISAECVILYNN